MKMRVCSATIPERISGRIERRKKKKKKKMRHIMQIFNGNIRMHGLPWTEEEEEEEDGDLPNIRMQGSLWAIATVVGDLCFDVLC